MKWSIFNFSVELENKVIIYNTINGGVISLEKDIYKNINNKKNPQKIINYLKQKEFIVKNSIDEKEQFMKSLLKEWNKNEFLGLHILTTTGCNFKCPYCYQSGIEANLLNEKKLNKIIKFLKNYIIENKIKEASLEITGGEPTTNWSIVEKLLKKINKIFKDNNIKYRTFIVTNGYNFTKEKVDLIQKYNWERLQVTLDGPKFIHNKRRILRNSKGTFDKIIENIEYIINNNKIEKINLRINYDKSNIKYIPEFLEFIKNKFGTEKILISLGLITKTVNCSEANKFINNYAIDNTEFFQNYINLYKKAFDLGFKMPDIFSFDGMCTSKLKHGFIIEPNGNIVKCVSGVGRPEFVIGNIDKDKTVNKNYLFPDLYEKCLEKECAFLPICHTGCRFESLVNNNDMHNNLCKKELLEKINNEIIKINYSK